MNYFEKLSDDPTLHILSYLGRNELLNVSLVNENFKRIVTESRETMIKIPLVLDFENPIPMEVIALAQKRQFRALELRNIGNNIWVNYTTLMEYLSNGSSVEYLNICSSLLITPESFQRIIDGFLPNLKGCTVGDIQLFNGSFYYNINASIANTSLNYLHIVHEQHIKFFSGCKALRSFEVALRNIPESNYIYEFLSQQNHLLKLKFRPTEIDLDRMVFPQLEVLILDCADSAVAEYICKLPRLKCLQINIFDSLAINRIMRAIANAPRLESLNIWFHCELLCNILMQFVNYSVNTLRIRDTFGTITKWLLQSFLGVKVIKIDLRGQRHFIDQSYLLLSETFNKIEFEPSNLSMDISFNPVTMLVDVKGFEMALLLFATKFSERIKRITVGHSNWLRNNHFTLHNSVCIELLSILNNVLTVELFSVEHYRELNYFLYRIRQKRQPLKNPHLFIIHRNHNEDRIKKVCLR